jgi:hypothetical protein
LETESHDLVCHPDTPALEVSAVNARVAGCDEHWLTLRWRIENAGRLIVPHFAGRGRADGLWATTCFELFVQREGEAGYLEFNLSPSERWAAYDFAGYRNGMVERAVPRDPDCIFRPGSRFAIFDAAIPRSGLPALPWRYGLSSVIEEAGGAKSYWAIAHTPGKPDFHAEACFTAALAATDPDEIWHRSPAGGT